MKKCVYIEDEKTLCTFGPRGFPNGKSFFQRPLSRIFWIQKNFLTKTLFLSQAYDATHARNGLSSTLFHLKTITVMSNTNYPVQYTIPVQDLDMDWFREQD